MKNEHGIECPIPLEQWPDEAEWCTVDTFGTVDFFIIKPYYYDDYKIFMVDNIEHRIEFSDTDHEGSKKHIWNRSQL
jgi:hypothetical protein